MIRFYSNETVKCSLSDSQSSCSCVYVLIEMSRALQCVQCVKGKVSVFHSYVDMITLFDLMLIKLDHVNQWEINRNYDSV